MTDNIIYLDNSATTKPCEGAIKNTNLALNEFWGNPSSLYTLGMDAERRVERARESVAKRLKAKPQEIIFTASGTEANNTAIFSSARARRKRGNRIVTTCVEHPSVAEPINALEREGFEVLRLPVNENGVVSPEDIRAAITKDTILVSIMAVNNETGAIMPLEEVAPAIKEAGSPAIFHTDAVQGFGKLELDPKRLGIHLLSASGHKLHAPKGIGFLYKAADLHLDPFILGGGQEKGMRSGTECVPLICALSGAIEELPSPQEGLQKLAELNAYAKEKLSALEGLRFNSPENALPYIINLSLDGIRSETALHFLESMGIFVSSGSACSKGAPSSVLTKMGLSKDRADSALRISLSRFTTTAELDALCEGLSAACQRLTRKRR